jgi:hypothetical protein
MKFKHSIVLLSACILQLSCATPKITNQLDTLTASELKPIGRTTLDKQKGLELISSAVHFGFSFEGEACNIYASVPDVRAHGYLQYELDGVYQKRVRISGSDTTPIQITVPDGKHTINVFKATEAHTGPIFIAKVTAKNIKSLAVSKAPIIEFIGNSITCGAAADAAEVACGAGEYHDQHNAYMAYGPRVARMLDVNYFLSSVSGIGIYRNWNSDGPNMPEVYEKVDFQTQRTQKWDFSTYSPAIVSIALGTNDFSNGDGKTPRKPFDAVTFIDNYVKFVQLVKSKYPKAQIALLSSPMVKGESGIKLEDCLTAVQQKIDSLYPADKKVAKFFFESMEARGCTGHPSVEDHAILADQLKDFFAGLLKS